MNKTVAGTATAFAWDVAGSVPRLLYDGNVAYVYGPDGNPLEQLVNGSPTAWYHHDQIGSTRVLTDSGGAVTATLTYDAYGRTSAVTGTATTPLGYNGQYTDPETGLIYLRARYYDPATAQFLSRDPLVATTGSAYGYVDDDPLNDALTPTGSADAANGVSGVSLTARPRRAEHSDTSAPRPEMGTFVSLCKAAGSPLPISTQTPSPTVIAGFIGWYSRTIERIDL